MKKVSMLYVDLLNLWTFSIHHLTAFYTMLQDEFGVWEVFLPDNADGTPAIPHGSRVKVRLSFVIKRCVWHYSS